MILEISMPLRVLVLGSKEYPFGSSRGEDPLPGGGIEAYVESYVQELAKSPRIGRITIVTRKFRGTPARERKDKIEVIRVPWTRGALFRNPSFNFNSYLAARGMDFDIVHANGPVAALAAEKLAQEHGVPFVATPHGMATGQPQYGAVLTRAIHALESRAYVRADAVVFLSEGEKEKFGKNMGFLPAGAVVIPTGIDIWKFSSPAVGRAGRALRKSLKLGKAPTIAFTGRLLAVKGVEYLLEAMAKLKDKSVVLLVAGDGPERPKLEAKARALGLGKRVRFLGQRTDIPAILAASQVFVLPSLSEGLPISMLEAMAAGIPCVVTEIGLPVTNRLNALVVPPAKPEPLARAIDEVLASKQLAKKLVKGGSRFAERFEWKGVCERYVKIFEKVSTRPKRRR